MTFDVIWTAFRFWLVRSEESNERGGGVGANLWLPD